MGRREVEGSEREKSRRRKRKEGDIDTLVLHDPAAENSENFGGRSPYGLGR
jgi:hypothetical protein